MDTQEAGQRLRRKIREQWPPLSQAEFARRLGIHPTLLARYLNGKRTPPLNFWRAAADLLSCDVAEITSSPALVVETAETAA